MPSAFADGCQQLTRWCQVSKGTPIDVGADVPLSFLQIQSYSSEEMDAFQVRHGIQLPGSYRYFLSTAGACNVFIDKYGLGIVFHRLEELDSFAARVFDNAGSNPFPRLLLVASILSRGDVAGFDMTSDVHRFAVFSHEDDPDTWLSDLTHWHSFEEWISLLVSSRGVRVDP